MYIFRIMKFIVFELFVPMFVCYYGKSHILSNSTIFIIFMHSFDNFVTQLWRKKIMLRYGSF